MPTIIRRGDSYLARVRKTGFAPVSQSFIRRSDAIAWGRKTEADMQSGRYRPVTPAVAAVPSLKAVIEEYRAKIAIQLKGARDYQYSFREIESGPLGAMPVDQIKPAQLADWRDALTGRGLKPATVCRRLGLLSAVLSWAHKEKGHLTENPMRSVRKPTVRDSRTRTLDAEEVRYLNLATAAARAKWLSDAVTLYVSTAMRRSELVSLRCSDVDLTRSVAVLRDGKTGGREVPLCPVAKAALERLIAAAAERGQLGVLPIEDPEAVSFAFRRAVVRARARYEEDCSAAGLPCSPTFMQGVRLHDIRHHSLSAWARTGNLSLFELLRISGHSSTKMLARYVNLSSEHVAAKMARVTA